MKPTAEVLQQEYIVKNRRVQDLAQEYGKPLTTVYTWLREAGISKKALHRERVQKPPDDQFYTEYIIEERPAEELAEKYGVTRHTIYKWAQQAEMRRRHPVSSVELLGLLKRYETENVTKEYLAGVEGVSLATISRRLNKARQIKAELENKMGMVTV